MVKVLNIVTGGLHYEGITKTQIEFVKIINSSGKARIDMAIVEKSEEDIIKEFLAYGCNIFYFPSRTGNILNYSRTLFMFLKNNKYDVVHVHGSSSIMYFDLHSAKKACIPIRIAHSRNTQNSHHFMHWILKPFFKRSFNVALACSQNAGEYLFGNKPFVVIKNGKDLSKFTYKPDVRLKMREKLELQNKKIIGFVGNLNEQKNPFFLIRMFSEVYKKNNEFHLVIIGDGPLKQELLEHVANNKLGDAVTFLGKRNDVCDLLQAFDVMVLPSLYEGLPNVVLEWQISGIPAFVSNNITTDCRLTDLVFFLTIDESDGWVNGLINFDYEHFNRIKESEKACSIMKNNGFDINDSAKIIEKIYMKGNGRENN